MSANRRFFALEDNNSVFTFKVDTSKIVVGATDGSQNPLTFRIPIAFPAATQSFIVRVSDGRADFAYAGNPVITFASSGIYTITLLGRVMYFSFSAGLVGGYGYDRQKIVSIDNWGSQVMFGAADTNWTSAFQNCINLIVNANNGLVFPNIASNFFQNIKGFSTSANLGKYDISQTTQLPNVTGITLPLYSVFSPFLFKVVNMTNFYADVDLSNVPKLEIISTSLVGVQALLKNSGFQGELIITANLTNIISLLEGVTNPPSLGKVDVTKVANLTTNFITLPMATANVDATLLGWVNNFDWSARTFATKSTYNFKVSKYSNNPAVIAAKTFLESKGLTFINLTMV